MKWVLTTREGVSSLRSSVDDFFVAAAMRVIDIEDVFVASIACFGQVEANW